MCHIDYESSTEYILPSDENITNAAKGKEIMKYSNLESEVGNKFKVWGSQNFASGSLSKKTDT
jgi:hypothetical protein